MSDLGVSPGREQMNRVIYCAFLTLIAATTVSCRAGSGDAFGDGLLEGLLDHGASTREERADAGGHHAVRPHGSQVSRP